MLKSKLSKLSAAELLMLHNQLQMRLVQSMAELNQMTHPDINRIAILGLRLNDSACSLKEIEVEIVERDMLDSLPDATGPEELAQIMQFIQ